MHTSSASSSQCYTLAQCCAYSAALSGLEGWSEHVLTIICKQQSNLGFCSVTSKGRRLFDVCPWQSQQRRTRCLSLYACAQQHTRLQAAVTVSNALLSACVGLFSQLLSVCAALCMSLCIQLVQTLVRSLGAFLHY